MNDNEQVGGNGFAIEKTREGLTNDDVIMGSVRNCNTSRGSSDHFENGGRTTLCLNVVSSLELE